MGAAGKREKTTKKKEAKDARGLKREEAEERVKEEAPRARSETEAPDGGGGGGGGGSPVDSGSDYEDYSEDGDSEDYELSEEDAEFREEGAAGSGSDQLSNLQVWFRRPKDIGNEDLIIVHEALDYGDCRLSLAIPKYGIFEKINSVKELAQMPQWTEEKPLRVATGFAYLGPKFMKENGLKHVSFSTGEGALEAAPVAVLVASRKSLIQWEGVLGATHEILERLEAHLKAVGQFTVTANMRGTCAEEVAKQVLSQPSLSGLQVMQ